MREIDTSMSRARTEWWREITRGGNPLAIGDLIFRAFDAGWRAKDKEYRFAVSLTDALISDDALAFGDVRYDGAIKCIDRWSASGYVFQHRGHIFVSIDQAKKAERHGWVITIRDREHCDGIVTISR